MDMVRARLEALEEYGVMDTTAESAFDELTELAAELFQAPISLVSLLDDKRQWFKSRVGVVDAETSIEHAFCAHAIHGADVMVVPDARNDERFADNPYVSGVDAFRFYAGAPLITPRGIALGTLCVIDREPRQALGVREKQILKRLAAFVMIELEYRRLAREAERQLEKAIDLIELELTAQRAMPAADPVSQMHAVRAVADRVDRLKDRCYRVANLLELSRQSAG